MATGFPVKDDYVTGDVLTAANMNDLSGTVNTLESTGYAAGKNKIINGNFGIWQRGTSFASAATASTFTADRWFSATNDGTGTVTVSQQTFTAGTAPVAGYEGQFFARCAITATGTATVYNFQQRIEDVRTFAGQTITISFWAKADSTRTLDILADQVFGSGGSSNVGITGTAQTLTTSFARYSTTIAVPSIAGKTIGTGSSFAVRFRFSGASFSATTTLDIWGVQSEAASTASEFQTATGTIQGELAACQRYYYRAGSADTNAYGGLSNAAFAQSTTVAISAVALPVQMRIAPTVLDFANVAFRQTNGSANGMTAITIDSGQTSATVVSIYGTTSSMTINLPGFLIKNNNSAGFLGFSAEL